MRDSVSRRAIRAALLLFVVALVVFLSPLSCATLKQSAFQGSLRGTGKATTYLDIASADSLVRLSGSIVVGTGEGRLSLKDPNGRTVLDERYARSSDASSAISFPVEAVRDAVPGVWLLEVGGLDEDFTGSYDLVLANR